MAIQISIATGNGLRLCRAMLASARAELDDLPDDAGPVLADVLAGPRIEAVERDLERVLATAEILPRAPAEVRR